ncbi:MAG: SIMPL domain-containing protein [Solirubrobacteraceae bacterium]
MPVRIAAAAVAGLLILAPAALADASTPATLSVDGSGSVSVAPDVASVSVSEARVASTYRGALAAANGEANAIIAAVEVVGATASGIQTQSITVSSTTVRVGSRRHRHSVVRYTGSEYLTITSKASLAGSVIDAATRAGAAQFYGPNFSFSSPSTGVTAATNAAVSDALGRAQSAAAILGYVVTGVQSVDLNPGSPVVGVLSPPVVVVSPKSGPGSSSAPTSISTGTQEVEANVTVVFTIGPAPTS